MEFVAFNVRGRVVARGGAPRRDAGAARVQSSPALTEVRVRDP